MDRLTLISQVNPTWYTIIEEFLINNPEFGPYAYLIPLKRPHSKSNLIPKTFIEHLLFYICESGVNRIYSQKQWSIMQPFLQSNNYDIYLMVKTLGEQLQPKKRQIYLDLWDKVKPIGPLEFKLSHLLETKIKGVGPGCIAQLKQFWSEDTDAVETSDRGFVAGFGRVYQIEKPTQQQIKKKVESWGNYKIVGGLICTQIFHYVISNK